MANCLKSIKSCLNPMKQNKDYEFVSYEQQTPEVKRNVKLNNVEPIIQIEYNQIETDQMIGLKKQQARVNLMNQFNQETIKPQFQSTRIIENSLNNDYTLYFSPLKSNKASSTRINQTFDSLLTNDLTTSQIESSYNSVTNSLYFSPPIKQNSSLISSDESYYSNEDTFSQTQSFSCDSNQFHSVKSSFFEQVPEQEENQIYVCTIPYQAKFQGDLNVNYSDRLKLIHSNQDYSLVQNISTKQCGYVPKISIILLTNFLNQF